MPAVFYQCVHERVKNLHPEEKRTEILQLALQRAGTESISALLKKAEKDFKKARFSAMQIQGKCN